MQCPKCKSELKIQAITKINAQNCKVLDSATTVLTIQCDNCSNIIQVPISNKNVLSVQKEKE